VPTDRSLGDAWGAWIERLAAWEWYLTLTFVEIVHPEAADKRWRAFVRQVEGKRGRQIAWVRALEYQRRGVIHFHALLAGMEFLAYNAVRRLWPWGFSWIRPYEPGRGANFYLGKYVAKGGEVDLVCFAPQYVAADQLLQAEGFVDVQYVKRPFPSTALPLLVSGEADLGSTDVSSMIVGIDQGQPIVMLAGLHVGCYELFGTDRIRALHDLVGKKVAIPALHAGRHLMLSTMLAYVGIDPHRDITWVTQPAPEAMRLLAEGQIDAFLGFPPEPQELRARRIGHLLLSMTVDRPWSQYYCCFVAMHRDFIRAHPMATKRALRAILKATNVCALEPERAAQWLVDRGFAPRYDYTAQMLRELPYTQWRDYDPEDTVRFYALHLYELGLITHTPQQIIAQGTDWRFLNELKKELKG
jgi:NitT/TauT family transport system substrate-binding protein